MQMRIACGPAQGLADPAGEVAVSEKEAVEQNAFVSGIAAALAQWLPT
jgi:hypothetical protein